MMVGAFVWLDIDAYRSIFTFIASHDLVGRVDVVRVPQDDPAPELFMEPRLLNPIDEEGSWWRVRISTQNKLSRSIATRVHFHLS